MNISMNKDLENAYKDQMFKGFSMAETGCIAIAVCCIVCAGIVFWHFLKFEIIICVYAGIPFGIPALVIGFKKIQGLSLTEYLKEIIYERRIMELTYDADEIPENEKYFRTQK